jgi:hypothetical protein
LASSNPSIKAKKSDIGGVAKWIQTTEFNIRQAFEYPWEGLKAYRYTQL